MDIKTTDFGEVKGKKVELFTITNKRGNSIAVTNYGATWVSAIVPDCEGTKDDVLLGFSDLEGYLTDTCYIGASIGRFANRIENARFVIDGVEYNITPNVAPNCLHGGTDGLSSRVWDSKVETDRVTFSIVSPDGDQGFPGELKVSVSYRWSDSDEEDKVKIEFKAETDKATPVNLTNHAYFNLAGKGKILDHWLKIDADNFLPMKEGCIVSGEILPVEGTPFDFREYKLIGDDIDKDHAQLAMGKGYDESFIVKNLDEERLKIFAIACDPKTRRVLMMRSSYPTVHLYTSNFLTSVRPGKKGEKYGEREAFCLEAQYSPNSPNLKDFPSCILRPGETYNHVIEIIFDVVN
ncbi:MAG: galactose mutarotase [Prevotellaceae bacterium]|jgi:aldose 1-epimerase|nr:galactose mutarotase [Prevotellaceae bacterium]